MSPPGSDRNLTLENSSSQNKPGTPEYRLLLRRYSVALAMTFVALGDHAAAADSAATAVREAERAGPGFDPATDTYDAA